MLTYYLSLLRVKISYHSEDMKRRRWYRQARDRELSPSGSEEAQVPKDHDDPVVSQESSAHYTTVSNHSELENCSESNAAKRPHTHRRLYDIDRYGSYFEDEDAIADELCTEWYQPAFRAAIFIQSPRSLPNTNQDESHLKAVENANKAFDALQARVRLESRPSRAGPHGSGGEPSTRRPRSPSLHRCPTRLVNIESGKIESGATSKPYVIGSFVWFPNALPRYPRNERRARTVETFLDGTRDYVSEEWEYATSDFSRVVDLVKEAQREAADLIPKFWIIDDTNDMAAIANTYPVPNFGDTVADSQRTYLTEVYYYLVAEAKLLGVQHVWLDCLCIAQDDEEDVAREVPRMTEYYRDARRCVVVSEMLRRGYSHTIDHLGYDFLDATLESELAQICTTEEHRAIFGLEDEILGWLVGFHQIRVWTFQETFLSKDVVHRGRNIRLNTRDILTYGLRSLSGRSKDSGSPTYNNVCREIHQKRLPICSVTVSNASKLTPNHCLKLIREQKRKTSRECDSVFGVLGLFEDDVKRLIPVYHNIPLTTLSAMLFYARVSTGDGMAFFIEEDVSPDSPTNLIRDSPGWLPNTTISYSYLSNPFRGSGSRKGFSSDKDGFGSIRILKSRELHLSGPAYSIARIRQATGQDVVESSKQQTDSRSDGDDGKRDWANEVLTSQPYNEVEIEPGNIVFDLAVRPTLTVHLYIKPRNTSGESAALVSLNTASEKVLLCLDTCKEAHFWLVLAACDDRATTWRIVGHLETSHIHGGIAHSGDQAPPKRNFVIP